MHLTHLKVSAMESNLTNIGKGLIVDIDIDIENWYIKHPNQEVSRLWEEPVAVLDGGQDDHVEDGAEETEGHLNEDIQATRSHLK